MAGAEIDDARFGPEACLARFIRNKCAVAAECWSAEHDMAVLRHAGGANRFEWYKGIVLGCDQQIRNADSVHYALGTSGFVIFLGVAITEMRSRDRVVEFTDGADSTESVV